MINAYGIVLALHNIMRWLVLLAGLIAAGRALYIWLGRREWTSMDGQPGLFFVIAMDLQLLLGLLLYVVLSPITTSAFRDFGAAMSNSGIRFFLVEHALTMVVAVVLAHIGRAMSRRATDGQAKARTAAIFYTLALIVILLGMPWFRPLLPTM